MVDRPRVLEKIDLAERWAARIEEHLPARREAYGEDTMMQAAIERCLQVAIEALLDAGHLFVSGLRLGLPDSEHGVVDRLTQAEVLTETEAALLDDMRGFRNVLVHQYGELDGDLVYEHATKAPEDVRTLADAYRRALEEHTAS